jgi:hypothetical protein
MVFDLQHLHIDIISILPILDIFDLHKLWFSEGGPPALCCVVHIIGNWEICCVSNLCYNDSIGHTYTCRTHLFFGAALNRFVLLPSLLHILLTLTKI